MKQENEGFSREPIHTNIWLKRGKNLSTDGRNTSEGLIRVTRGERGGVGDVSLVNK